MIEAEPTTRIDISDPARNANILFKAGDVMLLFSLAAAVAVASELLYDSGGLRSQNVAERVVQVVLPIALLGYAPLLAIRGYGRRYWLGHAWLGGLMTIAVLSGIVAVLLEDWTWNWAGILALGIFFAIWLTLAALPASLWLFANDLLTHRIEAYDARLIDIIGTNAVIPSGGPAATGSRPKPRVPFAGKLLIAAGMTGIAAFVIAFVVYAIAEEHNPALAELASDSFGFSIYGLPVSAILIGFGRRLTQPDASRLMESDERSPILLLRSFEDDPKQILAKGFATRFLYLGFRGRKRLEAAIAGELARFGPFIAIGKPGEKLPQLGAARAYFSDAEWQAAVRDWIGRARLIVMIAGRTPWVRWELGEIARAGRLGQLLLLMPPGDAADRNQRLDYVAESLIGTGYDRWLCELDASRILALRFLDGRQNAPLQAEGGHSDSNTAFVTLIEGDEPSEVAYELAIMLANAERPGQTGPSHGLEYNTQSE